MMIQPPISELTRGEFNRYELSLATAKCARLITSEYMRQREAADKANAGIRDADKQIAVMIDQEYRDEKAVRVAINKIHSGEYVIVRHQDNDDVILDDKNVDIKEGF